MFKFIKKRDLHLKGVLGPKKSGHEVDFGTYTHDSDTYTPWITKLNKHEGVIGEDASVLEVGFSDVALLFIKPGLTPPARLVVDNQKVMGVASENFNVQIKKQMDVGQKCFSFDEDSWSYESIDSSRPTPKEIAEARGKLKDSLTITEGITDAAIEDKVKLAKVQKAVNFLDKMSENFFVELVEKHNRGEVIVDMGGLASILTASYVLEEDDLHKGNIGFYVTTVRDAGGTEKKQFNFFKIDHDLMFTDSIMSQKDMRIANILYDSNSFRISTRDLDGFPDLRDSGNHYWPTQSRYLAKGDKAYSNRKERAAFANLKNNDAFTKAKWKYFLKSAIMPIAFVEKSLTSHLDTEKHADKINMVTNSITTRIGELQSKLLESQHFCTYIKDHGDDAFAAIKIEINEYLRDSGLAEQDQSLLLAQLQENFELLYLCTQNQSFTPIQKALLLGNYSYLEGVTPNKEDVSCAINRFQLCKDGSFDGVQTYALACVALNMVQKLGERDEFKAEIKELQRAKNEYLGPDKIDTLAKFKEAANKITASSLSLKQQKNEILDVLKNARLSVGDLNELKKELLQRKPSSQSLVFIKQLRSNLWLVRKIRGTYGTTTTSSNMVNDINAQLKKKIPLISKLTTEKFKKVIRETKESENLGAHAISPKHPRG